MNKKMGTLRLAIVLSVVFFVLGVMMEALYGEDLFFAIGIFGPILVWICYWGFWFVLKGFDSHQCENCEKNIGKLEGRFKFNDHVVCAECHKKLNENPKDSTS